MSVELNSRTGVHDIAVPLAQHLKDNYKDEDDEFSFKGDHWTQHVFSMLREFSAITLGVDTDKECFHRGHKNNRAEFLWDFLAVRAETGIMMAAESEQDTASAAALEKLKHDFQKLFYVSAPIRVLVCKSKDERHAGFLLDELIKDSKECCLSFSAGAVFLLHFCFWHNKGSRSYIWQRWRTLRGQYGITRFSAGLIILESGRHHQVLGVSRADF